MLHLNSFQLFEIQPNTCQPSQYSEKKSTALLGLGKKDDFRYIFTGSVLISQTLDYFLSKSSTHIRESDLKTKDYIKLMFNFEMSYINTNHDDFIGFTQAAANTANEVKKTQTKVENKVIRSGWLSLGNVGMMRGKFKNRFATRPSME